jgi:ABC-type uncharacterized transport system fused permease/ATPase subunit
VIARWLEICWQFVRLTFISQMNLILTPVIALLLCMPRYLEGSLSLGEVVQAAAAFVMVQGRSTGFRTISAAWPIGPLRPIEWHSSCSDWIRSMGEVTAMQ